jgi:serine O-acetyltransferase
MWVSDAFAAQVAYRLRCWAIARSVPVLPTFLHRFSMIWAQVCIGDPVVIGPGLYLAHGGVVIDGITQLGQDVVVFPGVTIGLVAGEFTGPTIGDGARIGTGAKVIGPVSVGDRAQVGANAVVRCDVPAGATAVGVPARVIVR